MTQPIFYQREIVFQKRIKLCTTVQCFIFYVENLRFFCIANVYHLFVSVIVLQLGYYLSVERYMTVGGVVSALTRVRFWHNRAHAFSRRPSLHLYIRTIYTYAKLPFLLVMSRQGSRTHRVFTCGYEKLPFPFREAQAEQKISSTGASFFEKCSFFSYILLKKRKKTNTFSKKGLTTRVLVIIIKIPI